MWIWLAVGCVWMAEMLFKMPLKLIRTFELNHKKRTNGKLPCDNTFQYSRSSIENLIPQPHPIIGCYILKSLEYLSVFLFPDGKYWVWREGGGPLAGTGVPEPSGTLYHCVESGGKSQFSLVLLSFPGSFLRLCNFFPRQLLMWSEADASNQGELLQEESLPSVLRKGGVTVLNLFLARTEWRYMRDKQRGKKKKNNLCWKRSVRS